MKRDLKQLIEQYEKGEERDVFGVSDYKEIMERSTEQTNEAVKKFNDVSAKEDIEKELLFNVMVNALEAGFMVGYKQALKENR
jgi:hypothetical protein